jgi:hypothetical protein
MKLFHLSKKWMTPLVLALSVGVAAPAAIVVTAAPAQAASSRAARVARVHNYWMARAYITRLERPYANFIVKHESTWRIRAVNRSSGAYGLCQALPGKKMAKFGRNWRTAPITQLKWCSNYAHHRYHSWRNAYRFWLRNHWW